MCSPSISVSATLSRLLARCTMAAAISRSRANAAASDQVDDYYTDGQLFMKSRAGALIAAGGFSLAR